LARYNGLVKAGWPIRNLPHNLDQSETCPTTLTNQKISFLHLPIMLFTLFLVFARKHPEQIMFVKRLLFVSHTPFWHFTTSRQF
jgi:hypothetical protein